MKLKDQTLLEEAYTNILNEDYNALTPDGPPANKPGHYNATTTSEELSRPTPPGIDPSLAKQYWDAFKKVQDGDISTNQWGDICAMMLAKVMGAEK